MEDKTTNFDYTRKLELNVNLHWIVFKTGRKETMLLQKGSILKS